MQKRFEEERKGEEDEVLAVGGRREKDHVYSAERSQEKAWQRLRLA